MGLRVQIPHPRGIQKLIPHPHGGGDPIPHGVPMGDGGGVQTLDTTTNINIRAIQTTDVKSRR